MIIAAPPTEVRTIPPVKFPCDAPLTSRTTVSPGRAFKWNADVFRTSVPRIR